MADINWRQTYHNDDPEDTLDRKLIQAEALALLLYGGGGEAFRGNNHAIQDRVCWLLSDLITDAREAKDAMDAARDKGVSP